MSRNKSNQLKAAYSAGVENVNIGIYTFSTEDGKTILVPARDTRALSKAEKAQLRYIESTVGRLTTGDLLLLFEDKEEGLEFLSQDEVPLLDLHNRINASENMKYFNVLSNQVTSVLLSEVLEGPVYLTTTIGQYTTEQGEDILCNRFIDQGSNRVFTYAVDPEHENLAEPVEVSSNPTAEIMCYIIDDIMFRVQLAKNPENDGKIETVADYLVPMESTMQTLVESGIVKLNTEG